MIGKNSERYRGSPSPSTLSKATLEKYEKLTLLDALKILIQRFSALSFLHLISNGLNEVSINSLTEIMALL